MQLTHKHVHENHTTSSMATPRTSARKLSHVTEQEISCTDAETNNSWKFYAEETAALFQIQTELVITNLFLDDIATPAVDMQQLNLHLRKKCSIRWSHADEDIMLVRPHDLHRLWSHRTEAESFQPFNEDWMKSVKSCEKETYRITWRKRTASFA